MPLFTSVLCALDSAPLAPRVLRHAAGIALATGAQLTVMKVVTSDPRRAERDLEAMLREVVPAGAAFASAPRIRGLQLTMGQPADAIVDMAQTGTDLIVVGTHSKSGWSRWLLGSTSAAILQQAPCPVLLVPPGQLEIVTMGTTTAQVSPGAVLVAIDLAEPQHPHLVLAGGLSSLANQPLAMMTVAPVQVSDAAAEQALRDHAAGAGIAPAGRVIVRRGIVADEIDHVAVAEHAGLVVMGLRAPEQGTPGGIATAVLKTKDAVVLAVPPPRRSA